MCLAAELASRPDADWGRVAAAARALFSRQPERRQQASRTLRGVLGMTTADGASEQEPHLCECRP